MKPLHFFVILLTAIFYWGVFGGHFAHQAWTNSNPDTFIHGGLALAPAWLVSDLALEWRKRRRFTGFDDIREPK